jgi:hypothetical protein
MRRTPAPNVFIVSELNVVLQGLEPNHKYRKWIADMKEVLKEHMYSGELIRKKQIPISYIEKFGVNHLYRYDHPEGIVHVMQ